MDVIKIIVARARAGWAVLAGGDLLSYHPSPRAARDEAEKVAASAEGQGQPADVVDLSHDAPPPPRLAAQFEPRS
jgi:hypothetical protein